MITPVLGVSALLTLVFAPDTSGFSVVTDLFALAGFNMDGTKGQPNLSVLQNIPGHLLNGLGAAIPLVIGTAISGIVGRWFKL